MGGGLEFLFKAYPSYVEVQEIEGMDSPQAQVPPSLPPQSSYRVREVKENKISQGVREKVRECKWSGEF